MAVSGVRADIDHVERPDAGAERLAGKAQAERPGKHLGKDGQDARAPHRVPFLASEAEPYRICGAGASAPGIRHAAERMKSRCGEIEESMAAFVRLKDEFEGLQSRIAPLDDTQSGVKIVINALADVRDHLNLTIERLDRDGEASLADRTAAFAETKKVLEGRVSGLIDQLSTLDQANKDIQALFSKLRGAVDAQLVTRDLQPNE